MNPFKWQISNSYLFGSSAKEIEKCCALKYLNPMTNRNENEAPTRQIS
jgi:hypothetical protein